MHSKVGWLCLCHCAEINLKALTYVASYLALPIGSQSKIVYCHYVHIMKFPFEVVLKISKISCSLFVFSPPPIILDAAAPPQARREVCY